MHLGSIANVEKTFFEDLPASAGFGLGRVKDWIVDKSNEYIETIRIGKRVIEENELKIENAEISFDGDHRKAKDGSIIYTEILNVLLKHKDPATKIFVTIDGSDPKSIYSQREEAFGQFELKVQDNITLRFVSQDKEGNFSRIITLPVTNEAKKYEIILPKQLTLGEPQVNFYFSKSLKGLSVTIKSLLQRALDRKMIDRSKLRQEIERILDEVLEE